MPDKTIKRILPAASSFGRKSLCAAAIAAVFLSGAHAAGLGKLTVFSALGQPLQAEIELTTASASELAALKVKLASADAFRQANIEFNPALISLRFATEQRGGRQIIRVTSSQPINEPFVDLLLEIASPDSRLVREYTFLLDPADLKKNQPAQMAATQGVVPQTAAPNAVVPQPAASNAAAPERRSAAPVAERGGRSAAGSVAAPEPQAAAPRRSRRAAGGAPASAGSESTVQVKPGDTLARIAGEVRQQGVSLDQMLVALQRANPDAFVGENMNRLRAGQILNVPGAEAARALPPSEAHDVVVAQASNFNEYRSKLAGQVAAGSAKPADLGRQSAAGKITARVEEQPTAANESKDKLKLSRAGVAGTGAEKAGGGGSEDKIAGDKALAEANSRVRELEKNVNDLQKLLELKNKDLADKQKDALAAGTTAGAAAGSVAAGAAARPPMSPGAPPAATPSGASPGAPSGAAIAGPEAPKVAATQATPNASAGVSPAPATSSTQPVGDASATGAATAAAKPVVPAARAPVIVPRPVATPSFMDDLLGNPLLLSASAVLLLLLGALGVRSARRRKAVEAYPETSLLADSALKTNSLFGSTGGQSVDTNNSVFNSGFAPSASQLDTNEVDPVAEADVYIAYGRDAQAEEILKEALRTQAERPGVRGKLLEIYANRKDLRSFETVASELYSLSKGESDEWRQAAVLGHSLDPKNPLYAGGKSGAGAGKIAPNPGASQSLDDLDLDALLNTTQTVNEQPTLVPDESHLRSDGAQSTLAQEDRDALPTLTTLAASRADVTSRGETMLPAGSGAEPQPGIAAAYSADNTASKLAARLQDAEPVAPLDFDFDLEAPARNSEAVKAARASEELPQLDAHSLGMDFESFLAPPPKPTAEVDPVRSLNPAYGVSMPEAPAPATLRPVNTVHGIEATHALPPDFDLSDISLDLDPIPEPELDGAGAGAGSGPAHHEGSANAAEFATKLDLALAYEEIGDKEGARELLNEVAKGGHPELSEKARGLLQKLA
ncbi:MAG: fimV [Herminiimonas sp.]|nr:fimV [Herminiimonas sp.]